MSKPQRSSELIPDSLNATSGLIVVSGIAVHSEFGPGLLESAYRSCLAHELRLRGALVESELEMNIQFKVMRIEAGYRLDLLVNSEVVVEIKAVQQLHPIHRAQLLTYMKLSGRRVGLLINFNVTRIKDGITRLVL